MLLLAKFYDTWFRVEEDIPTAFGGRPHLFDILLRIESNKYYIIKDRTGKYGPDSTGPIDVMVITLFAQGKTFDDLPVFNPAVTKNFKQLEELRGKVEKNVVIF
jgi:hypothetical protein